MDRRRVALITGASRGIGRAIAEQLIADHFDLTISARNSEKIGSVGNELRSAGEKVNTFVADMAIEKDILGLVASHLDNFGRLDLLVISAGMGSAGKLDSYPIRKFDKHIEVNVRSPFLLVQNLLPVLRSTAQLEPHFGSKVVVVSSITGMVSEPNLAAYGASKAALISLCESIDVDEADSGVTATSISPGYVDSDMSEWVREKIKPESMIRTTDIAILVSAISRLSRNAAVPNIAVTRPGAPLWRA